MPNSVACGPDRISQVYIAILALLVAISNCGEVLAATPPLHMSPIGANDHHVQVEQSQRLNTEVKKAGEDEEQQQQLPQRLVVKHDRFDPLRHFRLYKGGYDLKSKHYWASTWFTGMYGYFLGTIWFLGGIFGFLVSCIGYHRVRKKALQMQLAYKPPMISTHKSNNKLLPIILATLFSSLIICSCGVACVGSQGFFTMAKKVETTLITEGANNATRLIHIVTQMIGQMKVDIEPYDQNVAQRLDSTSFKLNKASTSLVNMVHDHKSSLDAVLLGLNVGVITLAMLNIALWMVGLAFMYLFPRPIRAFFMVVALGWLFISLNWVTLGITFSLSNFADDTCKALKEYQTSSKNTTLDDVLPCHDLAIGRKTVVRFREKIYNYIEEANNYISKRNYKQRQQKQLNEESKKMDVTDLPHVCNPFWGPPVYSPKRGCSNGTLSISSLPQFLTFFKCPSNKEIITNKTKDSECISTKQYNIASAYISATQKLLNLLPDVESLTGCSFVVDTFSIISRKECKPLKHSIRMVWISMVVLSTLTTLAMVLWLLKVWSIEKLNFASLKQGGSIQPYDPSPLPP